MRQKMVPGLRLKRGKSEGVGRGAGALRLPAPEASAAETGMHVQNSSSHVMTEYLFSPSCNMNAGMCPTFVVSSAATSHEAVHAPIIHSPDHYTVAS